MTKAKNFSSKLKFLQFFTVCFDDLSIPFETILFIPTAFFNIGISPVNEDQAISLGKSLMGRKHIHKTPWAVAKDRIAFFTKASDLADMIGKVADSVIVMDLSVFIQRFTDRHTVFRNDHRQPVTVVDFDHAVIKTKRITIIGSR